MDRTSGSKPGVHVVARAIGRVCAPLLLLSVGMASAQTPAPKAGTKTTPKADIPESGTYTVRDGDTMWDLSGSYFGSSYEWPKLWSYNPEITNPHWIYPGHVMRLRDDAKGGYSVSADSAPGSTADAEGGGLFVGKGRFGQGFGAKRFAMSRDGSIIVGEEVYLDHDALTQAGKIVGSYEDHMMMSPSDEIYLEFKKSATAPNTGRELTIFRHVQQRENRPIAGLEPQITDDDTRGEIVRVLGAVRVKSFDEDTRIARAVIVEALEPIERGFEVTDVPRTLARVPPRTNGRKIESKILASSRPIGVLGRDQIVFIGAGEKQGVQPGNRFLVMRQGDSWRRSLIRAEIKTPAERPAAKRPDDSKFPDEAIGEVRVLYVRPESCTGIITGAVHEIEPGDRVEMPEGF